MAMRLWVKKIFLLIVVASFCIGCAKGNVDSSGNEKTVGTVTMFDGDDTMNVSENHTNRNDSENNEVTNVNKSDDTINETVDDITQGPSSNRDPNLIVWALPDSYKYLGEPATSAFDRINDKLEEDGYPYQLEVVYIDDDMKYGSAITEVDADIVYTGYKYSGEIFSPAYKGIKNDKYYNLDNLLEGSELYDFFPESLWNSIMVNGGIYCIPNLALPDCSIRLLISKKYCNEEQLKNWDGTIAGLMEFVPEGQKFFCTVSGLDFIDMFGLQNCGYGITYVDGEYRNVFEYEKVYTALKSINELITSGMIILDTQEGRMQRNDEWSVAMFYDETETNYNSDDYWTYVFKGNLRDHFFGSTAILKNSHNPEGAFDILQLLLTDSEYGNLAVNGIEGVDYMEIDGRVYDFEGNMRYVFPIKFTLGIDVGIKKGEGGDIHTFANGEDMRRHYEEYIYPGPSTLNIDDELYAELLEISRKYSYVFDGTDDFDSGYNSMKNEVNMALNKYKSR